jgi:hypothetical protein
MSGTPYEVLVQKAARAICSNTDIAKPGQGETIFDNPDDLMWDYSIDPPRPLPRWRLYETRAEAVLEAIHAVEVSQAFHLILRQVKRGQNAVPHIVDRSFHDIAVLAERALEYLE